MQNNSQQDGHRRVRNVPIRLEGDESEYCRYVNNQSSNHAHENMDYEPQYCQSPHAAMNSQQFTGPNHNRSNQNVEPNQASSIDINYKSPSSQSNQPNRQHKHSQHHRGATPDSKQAYKQTTNHYSRSSDENEANEPNKENSGLCADRNKSPSNGDSAIGKDLTESDIQGPNLPDAIIPLPPPPEQQRSPSSQGEREDAGSQEQGEINDKKVKEESGPQFVINQTKVEVNRLLQEIANCSETSLKSREYLRLDEQLTVCILKLDDIQSPEWRQQRKEVINLINKCTELLERKINLNNDIKQLSVNCT